MPRFAYYSHFVRPQFTTSRISRLSGGALKQNLTDSRQMHQIDHSVVGRFISMERRLHMEGELDQQMQNRSEPPIIIASPLSERNRRDDSPLEPSSVAWRELAAVGAIVLLADVTIYRGHGFAGCVAFFLLGPAALLAGMRSPSRSIGVWVTGAMLVVLAAKLLWCGSVLLNRDHELICRRFWERTFWA